MFPRHILHAMESTPTAPTGPGSPDHSLNALQPHLGAPLRLCSGLCLVRATLNGGLSLALLDGHRWHLLYHLHLQLVDGT